MIIETSGVARPLKQKEKYKKFLMISDPKTGVRLGYACYSTEKDSDVMEVGFSVVDAEDVFDREKGKALAEHNLELRVTGRYQSFCYEDAFAHTIFKSSLHKIWNVHPAYINDFLRYYFLKTYKK